MGGWLASYLRGLPEGLTYIYDTLNEDLGI